MPISITLVLEQLEVDKKLNLRQLGVVSTGAEFALVQVPCFIYLVFSDSSLPCESILNFEKRLRPLEYPLLAVLGRMY